MESAAALADRGESPAKVEHAGNMRHVSVADLLRILPCAEIVVPLRQAQATLAKARNHFRRVLVVDLHVEMKADVQA